MLNRKYNLKLDLQFRCNNSNMEFNQFDKNTSDFFMQINRSGKEIDLSKALVTLIVIKPNGNVDSQFLEVDENGVYANLKPSLKDIPGDYQCKAIVTVKDETVIPDQIFTYTVNEDKFLAAFNSNMVSDEDYSLLTDILGRLSTIETDEEQRQINEATRILNEETRQAEENKRVEAELVREHNDADREKAEAIRETNEHNRKVSENTRVDAEALRVEVESNRVDAEALRVEAEKLRNDNYDFMTSDEERRRNEENVRIEAERLRKQAETARVNAESQRRTVEQVRVLKENERNCNEVSREANEVSRKANEEKRVHAETDRSNRYNNFITDAESAANSFKAYTSTAKQEEETRKTNELARVEAEGRRKDNEVLRISDENTRKYNESKRVEAETARQSKFDAKIVEVNNKVQEVNVAKDTMVSDTNKAIEKMNNDFNSLSSSQQQDAEVILARDGEESLNARFERDLYIDGKSLKQEVIDLGGLKESQDMAYSSDNIPNYSGSIVCKETKNGTVKDLNIKGKSLINLCASKSLTGVGNGVSTVGERRNLNKPISNGTLITVAFDVSSDTDANNVTIGFYSQRGEGVLSVLVGNVSGYKGTRVVRTVTVNSPYPCEAFGLYIFKDSASGSRATISNITILEGDHTQNPPSHFEGIASVGTGVGQMGVSTNNANLFNEEHWMQDKDGTHTYDGKDLTVSGPWFTKYNIDYIPVNTKFVVCGNAVSKDLTHASVVVMYKDGTHRAANMTDGYIVFDSKSGVKELNFYAARGTQNTITYENVGIFLCDEKPNFVIPKRDKKLLLFKDVDNTWKPIKELRGLDTVCDTVELHSDGKYYYHIRTEKRLYSIGDEDNLDVITDKINTIAKLAKEKVFEVNPLFLEAYEGETMVSVNGGVINAPIEFKLTSSLPNLVLLNQKRIKELENQMLTMFKSVLNGDMRTLAETIYPEDFTQENIATPIPEL